MTQKVSRSESTLDEALSSLATFVGLDIAYLANPDEAHFDPISVMLGFSAVLLAEYARGFCEALKSTAFGSGERTGRRLARHLRQLFEVRRGPERDDVLTQLHGAGAEQTRADSSNVAVARETTIKELTAGLEENGMPPDRARDIATLVDRLVHDLTNQSGDDLMHEEPRTE